MEDYPNNEMLVAVINAIDSELNQIKQNPLQLVYPVGSVYISVLDINPNTAFGFGEWEQIKDVFLLSAGNIYNNGETGGEAAHTLTVNEMPSHTHRGSSGTAGAHSHTLGTDMDVTYNASGKCCSVHKDGVDPSLWNGSTSTNGGHTHTINIENTGNNVAHNNMPPYLTVYMWKRIS